MGKRQTCTATSASTGERCKATVAKVSVERCPSHLNAEEKAVRDRLEEQERAAWRARRDQEDADQEELSRYLHLVAREAWDRGTDRADATRRVMSKLAFEYRTRGEDLIVEESPPMAVSEHQCHSVVFVTWVSGHNQLACQLAACQLHLDHRSNHYSPGGPWTVSWNDAEALPAKTPAP